jgi:RND family efflux transporter MFP subunit
MKHFNNILWAAFFLGTLLHGEALELSGSVVSDNQKIITSRHMGFVKHVHVNEGEEVKKGELLYEIDSKEIDSAKLQAQLAIGQAQLSRQMHENQYHTIQRNLSRHKRLYAKDMVAKVEVENLELASENLKAMIAIANKQIEQARARLQEVLHQYNYLSITAPNDAVVVQKNVNVGEMAMPGAPAFVLSDLRELVVHTQVPESQLHRVHVNKAVTVEIPSLGLVSQGNVASIIPSSNPMTHTFTIKIAFDTKEERVYPGMYALIRVP